jgi:hypothetical protein
LNDLEQRLENDKNIFFYREILTKSSELRDIDLLTITSHKGKLEKSEEKNPDE